MRPKLCYVVSGTGYGGAVQHLLSLAARVDRAAFEPAVVSVEPAGTRTDDFLHLPVPVYPLDVAGWTGVRRPLAGGSALLRLAELLGRMKPALVHAVGSRVHALASTAARMAGVRHVVCSAFDAPPDQGWLALAARAAAGAADVYVAPTPALARDLVRRAGVHPRKIAAIPPGVDLERVVGHRPLPIEAGGPLIGAVGRLAADKGTDTLLEAFVILRRYRPTLRLALLGAGPEAIAWLRRAQRLGIDERVSFLGEREDVGAFLAALEVFVHPIRRAGVPMALLEALAAGVPAVATDVAAVRDVMDAEAHGLLVRPGHPALLADAIDRALEGPEAARARALAAQIAVAASYPVQLMAAAHDDLYRRLLGLARRQDAPAAETMLV